MGTIVGELIGTVQIISKKECLLIHKKLVAVHECENLKSLDQNGSLIVINARALIELLNLFILLKRIFGKTGIRTNKLQKMVAFLHFLSMKTRKTFWRSYYKTNMSAAV